MVHAVAAPWVRMIRSGLEPRGFFLCFSASQHRLNISTAAARIVWPRLCFSSGMNLNKVQGCFLKSLFSKSYTVSTNLIINNCEILLA